MEGGLIDGETLRRALDVLNGGQKLILLARLSGASNAEIAEALSDKESRVADVVQAARERVARKAPGAEVLLDAVVRQRAGEKAADGM